MRQHPYYEVYSRPMIVFDAASVIAATSNLVFAFLAYHHSNWLAFNLNISSGILVILNLIFMKLFKRFFLSANILVGCVTFAIFFQQLFSDKAYSHLFLWGCLLPIFSAILTNKTYSFIWTILSLILFTIGFHISDSGTLNDYLPFWVEKIVTYDPEFNFILALNISILGGMVVSFFVANEFRSNIFNLKNTGRKNQLLLNILTHDISTPLQVLRMSNNLLSRCETSEQQTQKINDIDKRLDDIEMLLNEVRGLNALSCGKTDLAYEKFDLVEFLQVIGATVPFGEKFYVLSHKGLLTNKVFSPLGHLFENKSVECFPKGNQKLIRLILSTNKDLSHSASIVIAKVVCEILGINLKATGNSCLQFEFVRYDT